MTSISYSPYRITPTTMLTGIIRRNGTYSASITLNASEPRRRQGQRRHPTALETAIVTEVHSEQWWTVSGHRLDGRSRRSPGTSGETALRAFDRASDDSRSADNARTSIAGSRYVAYGQQGLRGDAARSAGEVGDPGHPDDAHAARADPLPQQEQRSRSKSNVQAEMAADDELCRTSDPPHREGAQRHLPPADGRRDFTGSGSVLWWS